MKLLIVAAVAAIATASIMPELQIKSLELPQPAVPQDETAYVPQPEPISLGMIMVPQEVIDAVAAEQAKIGPVKIAEPVFNPMVPGEMETLRIAIPQAVENIQVEPVKVVDAPIELVDNNQNVAPVKVIDMPVIEPIRAGELEIIRVITPEILETMNHVVPVKIVDTPIEQAEHIQENIVEPVKFHPLFPNMPIQARFPHMRYDNPYLR